MTSIIQNNTLPSIPSGFSTCYYLNNLKGISISLSIPNNTCNSDSLTLFDLSAFIMLQSITIGDDNFMYASTFIIDSLFNLQSIDIQQNSFTTVTNGVTNNGNRSFSILNCVELESIEIGEYSFSDYGGGFELFNLPKLSIIKIGQIGSDSLNFFYSSFVIKGIIDVILVISRSSTFEFH